MDVQLTGQWRAAIGITGMIGTKLNSALEAAVMMEAQRARRMMVKGIRDQAPGGKAFKPLSETTLALRRAAGFRGSKALIRTGTLIRNITVQRVGTDVFVGIMRSARTADGKSLVNLAEVHEKGKTIFVPFTEKARKFLFANLRKGGAPLRPRTASSGGGGGGKGKGVPVLVIRIPARPFVEPVFRKLTTPPTAVTARILANVAARLGLPV